MPIKINPPQKILSFLVPLFGILTGLCLVVGMPTLAFSQNLDRVKIYLLEGDYKGAISEGEKLIAQDSNSRRSDELYFVLGLSYLKDGNYLRASDIFEIIQKEFKGSRFKDESLVCLGDTYFLRQDYTKAKDCYQELINGSPSSKFKPLTFYRLSQIGFKAGDTEQGKKYCDKLKQEFPLSMELIIKEEVCSIDSESGNFFYTVQVGSFSSIVNAKNLTQKLVQKGYPAYSEEVNLNGKTSYRVRIGKLRTLKEAQDLAGRLTREGYPTRICP